MGLATDKNISERRLIGLLLNSFKKPLRISTIQWAKKFRVITQKESSFGVGRFNPDLTPYMEYVYECLDSIHIPNITAMKSARIAWTETLNNYRGRRIHSAPCSMLLGFSTKEAARTFAKGKWKEFIQNVSILSDIIDVGIAENKKSIFDYQFPNGSLKLVTLGSIANQKSDNYEYIEIEEPDDAKDDVKGQGDTFANLKERQKLVPVTRKKFIFGGTPTHKDFSRVEKAYNASNKLIFKAECHCCNNLVAMDYTGFDHIKYDEYPDRLIDEIYGKYNPYSAYFECPFCQAHWSFEQKNENIKNGKKYGFTDHTGNFSKGWHPEKPEITDVFGFSFSELLSPFPASSFVELAKAMILADIAFEKGDEAPMKSLTNNKKGQPYASGVSAIEAEDLKKLRLNYPEHIVPMEGLVLTAGIDVQHNRFAYVILAWGRNNNCYLVSWKEIFGDVTNQKLNSSGKFEGVWGELSDIMLDDVTHSTGKKLKISAVSIDSGDQSELVYNWVKWMNNFNPQVFATKGVRDLKFSEDEIYSDPTDRELETDKKVIKSLAETMGVTLYHLGAHRAHEEILHRLARNKNREITSNVFFFNEQSYGMFEEQMTSCRKIIDLKSSYNKSVYKLIPGKRKEAMDACKNAFHASYAIQLRNYTYENWKAIEDYLYKD